MGGAWWRLPLSLGRSPPHSGPGLRPCAGRLPICSHSFARVGHLCELVGSRVHLWGCEWTAWPLRSSLCTSVSYREGFGLCVLHGSAGRMRGCRGIWFRRHASLLGSSNQFFSAYIRMVLSGAGSTSTRWHSSTEGCARLTGGQTHTCAVHTLPPLPASQRGLQGFFCSL